MAPYRTNPENIYNLMITPFPDLEMQILMQRYLRLGVPRVVFYSVSVKLDEMVAKQVHTSRTHKAFISPKIILHTQNLLSAFVFLIYFSYFH